MKIKEIKLLSFRELNEDQRQEVLEKNYHINVNDDFWYESILDDWKERLEETGFKDIKIYFSGFYSQDAGAMFTSSYFDFIQVLKNYGFENHFRPLVLKLIQNGNIEFSAKIEHKKYTPYCFYYHEKCNELDINFHNINFHENLYLYVSSVLEEIQNLLTYEIININRSIYRDLENEYLYLTGREQIEETLILNEYYFNEENLEIEY